MAFSLSTYVDPSSYIEEKIQPGAVAVSSERIACVVAIAPRTRQYTNEAVVRGKVYAESLTAWSASTPYRCILTNTADRDRNNAILYQNGNAMALGNWSFVSASLTGNAVAGAAMDTTLLHKFTLSMDKKDVVTLTLTTKAPATPLTTIASELNAALAAIPAYGAAYVAVFTTITTAVANDTLVITSPITTSSSDLKIFFSYEDIAGTYDDMASTVSNGAWAPTTTTGVQAPTYVEIIDAAYVATATYTIDYVTVDIQVDPLNEAATGTPLSSIVSIGSYPSAISYTNNYDYEATGNTVDWYVAASWANATLAGVAGPYAIVLNTNDHLYFYANSTTVIDITLTPGGARTAAQVAEDINLALNASSVYGPEFTYVASDNAGTLELDVPAQFENFPIPKGQASYLIIGTGTYNAATTLFGLTTAQLPYEVTGTGQRPGFGTTYYTTYNVTRASTDYDEPHRVYNDEQLKDYTSPLNLTNYTTNLLAVAGEIGLENYAPSLYIQQINDTVSPGTPTQTEINTAIDNCAKAAAITEVVVIDTSEATAVSVMDHVSNMSSMLEKKPRRGWYGMARGTDIGDPDTPDTFLYRANRTLQPGGTSTGRGRQILVAPGEATRTLTMEDGTEIDVNLDGSYIATAVAALSTSLASPADPLIRKTIRGFKTDDNSFETYLQAERYTLAGGHVTVVTLDAGRLILLDPLTTESGGVIHFEEPMASAQKDSVTNTVNTLLDANIVGVVPEDLADFISDIKLWIMLGIQAEINAGTIGPYTDENNNTREIDPKTDIQVWQDETDPRTFLFNYWYNLRYPVKRVFGQYSVDNPFFAPSS